MDSTTKPEELVTKTCPGCGRRILAPKRGNPFNLDQWCADHCAGTAPAAPTRRS